MDRIAQLAAEFRNYRTEAEDKIKRLEARLEALEGSRPAAAKPAKKPATEAAT